MLRPFGSLEAAVMDVLWSAAGPATVREVLDALSMPRPLAYTTVMTVLDNLHRKGWLRRERDGRAYRYAPLMSRAAYSAQLISQVVADSPDPQAVFLHLVGALPAEEMAQLRAALRRVPKATS